MIAFDFDYYKPDFLNEAVRLFYNLSAAGKQPYYYNGGTEIITMARRNRIRPGAVIDIKGIPECNVLEVKDSRLTIGASITLTQISESNIFPLLGKVVKFVGDHTVQDKITIGGNICGEIPFREAVLPFLLSDSHVVIAGREGSRSIPINDIFAERLQLNEGELLVQIITDSEYINLPHEAVKRTKIGPVGYPLVTAVALKKDDGIRLGFSGTAPFPFRAFETEKYLKDMSIPSGRKAEGAAEGLTNLIRDTLQGSKEYKEFVVKDIILNMLERLGDE